VGDVLSYGVGSDTAAFLWGRAVCGGGVAGL
jgi:hypothetical protein